MKYYEIYKRIETAYGNPWSTTLELITVVESEEVAKHFTGCRYNYTYEEVDTEKDYWQQKDTED